MPGEAARLGCGAGHYSLLLARHFKGRFEYVGCDYSREMVTQAQVLFPSERFVVNDVLANTLDLDEFDVVVANGLVEVVADYRKALDTLLAPAARWVLINRVKLSERETKILTQDAYGHKSDRVLLAENELEEIARSHGRKVAGRLDRQGEVDHAFLLPLDFAF